MKKQNEKVLSKPSTNVVGFGFAFQQSTLQEDRRQKIDMAEGNLRVYLCGGHSTGKTTILTDVLDYVRLEPKLNVARGVMQQLGKLVSVK